LNVLDRQEKGSEQAKCMKDKEYDKVKVQLLLLCDNYCFKRC